MFGETQEAAVETARRKMSEIDAELAVAQIDVKKAESQLEEAKSAHQQALDELETKRELQRRNPGNVAFRDIEKLTVAADGRLAAVTSSTAAMQSAQQRASSLLPAQFTHLARPIRTEGIFESVNADQVVVLSFIALQNRSNVGQITPSVYTENADVSYCRICEEAFKELPVLQTRIARTYRIHPAHGSPGCPGRDHHALKSPEIRMRSIFSLPRYDVFTEFCLWL